MSIVHPSISGNIGMRRRLGGIRLLFERKGDRDRRTHH